MGENLRMTKARLEKFTIKNYRSIKNLTINFPEKYPFVICGENNIGKTNVLRALNVFFHFNHENIFYEKEDLPYQIYYGSRGSRKTTFEGDFLLDGQRKIVKIKFDNDTDVQCFVDKKDVSPEEALSIIENVKYYFIEASNINIPEILSESIEDEILLPLDGTRKRQTEALRLLDEFVKKSREALLPIETEINKYFTELSSSSTVLNGKKIKISFGEYNLLREALNNLVSITLEDGNENALETKGSGAQRLVFMALMQYIANQQEKNVLWGIDEPEVFLQPMLQKELNRIFNKIALSDSQMIITTHSQYFINTDRCENIMLMEASQTEKQYVRKSGRKFYEIDAKECEFDSDTLKIMAIKKHLGISGNDGWALMPSNILVEGESDKKYIEMYINYYKLNRPCILYSGGVSKQGAYIDYLNNFAEDLPFKPTICCLYDDDDAGVDASRLSIQKSKNITVKKFFISQRTEEKKKDAPAYAIEDFLPENLIYDAINAVLKQCHYKKILERDFNKRKLTAYNKRDILSFLEELIRLRNPDKNEMSLKFSYKRMLCQKCCLLFEENPEKYLLAPANESFLRRLVDEANNKSAS